MTKPFAAPGQKERLLPGTPVMAIWGRPADPAEAPEVLRHAGNGVWVMYRDTMQRGIVIAKARYPRHALAV